MVAVISTMQKEALPVVVTPELPRPKTDKKYVLLASWASVSTALLIVVLIGGAFYVADLKNPPSQRGSKDFTRTYDYNGEKTTEESHLNGADQTELMIKKSDDGRIEMITSIDYRRKMSASYLPSLDVCFLLAGDDVKWVDTWDQAENETIKVFDDRVRKENFQISDNKVTDLSILPEGIKPYCEGKPTYWLQPEDADNTGTIGGRQKRMCPPDSYSTYCYWYTCGCNRCRRCISRPRPCIPYPIALD